MVLPKVRPTPHPHPYNQLTAVIRFTQWAEQYGGLYSLKLGTGTAIVVTDRRIVKELVDRKSSKYSNRPESHVAHEITGGDHLLAMQYGQLWRTFRKLVHQHFMESMVEKSHIRVQDAEAVQMLRDFVARPDQHMLHPKRYSNSITMSLGTYDTYWVWFGYKADWRKCMASGLHLCTHRT